MNRDPAENKHSLRCRIQALRRQFSGEAHALASAQLCEQLRTQPIWRESQAVLLFSPLPDEPNIAPLLEEALRAGKDVALPRFDSSRQDYVVCRITEIADLRRGYYGILEPSPECGPATLNQLDFAFVPGVAFDVSGRRLGRGKGYFDRLLAQVPGHKCGVAFDWQVVAAVTVEPHDICVNSLLTPSRWIRCPEGRAVLNEFF